MLGDGVILVVIDDGCFVVIEVFDYCSNVIDEVVYVVV